MRPEGVIVSAALTHLPVAARVTVTYGPRKRNTSCRNSDSPNASGSNASTLDNKPGGNLRSWRRCWSNSVNVAMNRSSDESSSKDQVDGKAKNKTNADEHKNEGPIKNWWHNLTGQHSEQNKTKNNEEEDEPKKASGSGSG